MTSAARRLLPELAVSAGTFVLLVVRAPTLEHFLVNSDHGYQLAAGAQLLDGRIPAIDSLHIYGPLVAVLAVATGGASGELVGEVLACAAAWALTIGLAFRLARRRFGAIAAWSSAILALLFLARFHKWYVWLIPIAALTCLDRATEDSRWWWRGGWVCGIGALLRPELGAASALVLFAFAVVDGARRDARSPLRARVLPLLVGFGLPLVVWMTALVVLAGARAPLRALAVTVESVVGSARHLTIPPPPFRPSAPFGKDSSHALALVLLPIVDVAALAAGGRAWRRRAPGLEDAGRCLAAIGVLGLAVYPHTIHRADLNHFWQGAWPLALALPGLCALAARAARRESDARRAASGRDLALAAGVLVAVCAVPLTRLAVEPHRDLAPLPRAPLAGLTDLVRGLEALPNDPNAELVRTLARLSGPDDEILVAAAAPQLPVFAQRPANGLCVMYQPGLFDSPAWRREHVAWLERHPPALVVGSEGLADSRFRRSQPEMWETLRARYTTVVARIGGLVVLAPAADPPRAAE
ncbi:MAG: hypothetical protein IT294_06850 [Deltaproteobacteria bacterium]|nr:hypothetical protein [Deltaproteobacteria bacterium]